MIPQNFEYSSPANLQEALGLGIVAGFESARGQIGVCARDMFLPSLLQSEL